MARTKCYFDCAWEGPDIEVDAEGEVTKKGENRYKKQTGRINFVLFDDVVPKTAENFSKLCNGDPRNGYKNTIFHNVVPNFKLEGGDYRHHNGTGGRSIWGGKFEDENFKIKHDRPFLLAMANNGPNTNTSTFFITLTATSWLNGKNVVFGEVDKGDVESMRVVRSIENSNTRSARSPDVTNSGTL